MILEFFDLPCHILHYKNLYSQISNKKVISHPLISAQIISETELISIAKVVIAHHERFDGRGYPLGLEKNAIPEMSQIVRVADSISTKYHFSNKLSMERAIDYVRRQNNREFSGCYLARVISALKERRLFEVINDTQLLKDEINGFIRRLYRHHKRRREDLENILFFLGDILDVKHSLTRGHSMRVAKYSVMIGLSMGLEKDYVAQLRIAGILHDIGKLGIPKNILEKPGPLTKEEFEIIRTHPPVGIRIIRKVSLFKRIIPLIEADQEQWDGSGYPRGLKGEDIPLGSRIILVADAFDAMTSDRSYRKAMPVGKALKELKRCAGKDFDREVVEIACKIFRNLPVK